MRNAVPAVEHSLLELVRSSGIEARLKIFEDGPAYAGPFQPRKSTAIIDVIRFAGDAHVAHNLRFLTGSPAA
jgi:hypothetical protein